MAEATDTFGIMNQNLRDAGCSKQVTEKCMSFAKKGDVCGMLMILTEYRASLLGTIRSGQKQIDCLDYLIYKLKKEII